jgi:hypothetical protein
MNAPDSVPAEPVIGNWTIEKNFPYGFVIRNVKGKAEYHFFHDSNDWITVGYDQKPTFTINGRGKGPARTVFCDRASTQKMERIDYLRNKGKDLTETEARELLTLAGLVKEG